MNSSSSPSSPIIKHSTARAFQEVCGAVEAVCREFEFGLIGTIDLTAKMNAKGVPFDRNCTVFEVCNPKIAAGVLNLNMDIANALPCRLAVYEEDGTTVVSTLRPTHLLDLFEVSGAEEHAQTVEAIMSAIVRRLTE